MHLKKVSGPALFMYSVIVMTVLGATVCFWLYYGKVTDSKAVLWTGIVSFMIMYHFWLRIIMGNVSKLFNINHNHWWFREKIFEKKLYRLLRVKKWKGKALTYNPESFSLEKNSLYDIATTMVKSETDHWINELISVSSILFAFLWGEWWIFIVTAIAAMVFDAQFIIIQRYNRPRVLRILERKSHRASKRNGAMEQTITLYTTEVPL